MIRIILITLLLTLSNCSLNKVVRHHGIHNLENKQLNLKINETNRNDILKIIGPPSTKSIFDNDIYIYIERKTTGSKVSKFGKKKLLVNNVLVLEINDKGLLVKKSFYGKNEMRKITFDKNETGVNYSKQSFINDFLFSLRQRIDDPLGKKRVRNE